MVLFFTHIPFVVNHTINATPPEMLQQYQHSYTQPLQAARNRLKRGYSMQICGKANVLYSLPSHTEGSSLKHA